MSKSISQLKKIVKEGSVEGIRVYQEELNHNKQHKEMNITLYTTEFNRILSDIGVKNEYNKLNENDKMFIMCYMEKKYDMLTPILKLRNTVYNFKAPELKLWLLVSTKK